MLIAPVKNSLAGISRAPPVLATTMVASRQEATAGSSADGSACAMLPQTVPRLRISRWPTQGSASRSRGTAAAASSYCTCRWRTVAPTRRWPLLRDIRLSSGTALMSTSVDGRPSRIASTGTSDWPPASTLAPSRPSSARASSVVPGRT